MESIDRVGNAPASSRPELNVIARALPTLRPFQANRAVAFCLLSTPARSRNVAAAVFRRLHIPRRQAAFGRGS
jgi:hypothetical protein